MIVCSCRVVTDRQITEAAENGLKWKQLVRGTGVATECGKCAKRAKAIYDDARAHSGNGEESKDRQMANEKRFWTTAEFPARVVVLFASGAVSDLAFIARGRTVPIGMQTYAGRDVVHLEVDEIDAETARRALANHLGVAVENVAFRENERDTTAGAGRWLIVSMPTSDASIRHATKKESSP